MTEEPVLSPSKGAFGHDGGGRSGMAQEPALSLPKGSRSDMAEGSGPETPRAKTPGGVPPGFARWLNRTAVEQVRV